MWTDRLRLAESLEAAWLAFAPHERVEIRAALEVIDEDPIIGAPLFEPLRGYWSYRAGHIRILYKIASEGRFVIVLHIGRAA